MRNFPDRSFNHVVSFGAISTLTDDLQCMVLKELMRVLKPGGKMFLGHQYYSSEAPQPPCTMLKQCLEGKQGYVDEENYGAKVLVCSTMDIFFGILMATHYVGSPIAIVEKVSIEDSPTLSEVDSL